MVVIIIAAVAALAIPAATQQIRDQRVQQAAERVSTYYRNARTRAMGRGAAVLVRYDASVKPEGVLEVREAVRGAGQLDPNCIQLPVNVCDRPGAWVAADTRNNLVTQFDPAIRDEFNNVRIEMRGPAPLNAGVQAQMDVCFTPLGRAFVRFNQLGPFVPLTGVARARVFRTDLGNNQVGLARNVLISPSGHARRGASEVP